jgi:ABC-type cobalamin/Fe3+-siderophores transport system ATPase subunit
MHFLISYLNFLFAVQMFVEEVMELVELKQLRNAQVGLPGIDGLSIEQRKRLTIAVELVANPSIIFMDEPTSGLDARAAAIVMCTVRNTVDIGRTVVYTIHQPSIDNFEAFDEVLLHFLNFLVKVCYFYIFYASLLQHVFSILTLCLMQLLLMKRGGQVIYTGPIGHHSHKLVEYFEVSICSMLFFLELINMSNFIRFKRGRFK